MTLAMTRICRSSLLVVAACAGPGVSYRDIDIRSGYGPPETECRAMGTVVGQGGGFGGAMISNERLIQNAEDDAREKAAAMEADYVQLGQASLGQQQGTTTTATVTGTAFDCTPDALPSAPASASGAPEGARCASHVDCAAELFCDSIRHVCSRP